ncbi:MAG: metal-dependent hydrolase [Pseudomonadota bacterium]
MFVGHYAAALAAKAMEPRAPLWTYVGAAQLLDIAWAGLVMGGVERVSFDKSLPGSPLVLEHMPWTHSLPAAVLWSLVGLFAARAILRIPWTAAFWVGLVVFSHWATDWLVHRPDLELWPGGQKVGLALWDFPTAEKTLEMGLIALAGGAWLWKRGKYGRTAWPAMLFLAFLGALQLVGEMVEPAGDAYAFARLGLAVYLTVIAVAFLADLGKNRESA